jgi:hypothetical protein
MMLNKICLEVSGYVAITGAQYAYGETPETSMPLPAAQPIHPEIAILNHGG